MFVFDFAFICYFMTYVTIQTLENIHCFALKAYPVQGLEELQPIPAVEGWEVGQVDR